MLSDPNFQSLEIGEKLTGSLTITDSHIVLACGIFGDFAPLHVDEEYAQSTRYGGRLAHGPLLVGIMSGVLGNTIGKNANGLLEQNVRYLGPVHVGDTVRTVWEVTEKIDKPRLDGGLVRLAGTCTTQRDVVAVSATALMLVGYGPKPEAQP